MNTENIDIEQMRKAWLAMGEGLGMKLPTDNNPDNLNRKKTALDRLRDKYRIFFTISLLMIFVSFMVFSRNLLEVL